MQNPETLDDIGEAAPWRDYLALSGTIVADRALVRRLGHAAFLCRLIYNAAIEDRVSFAVAFAYRYTLAEARRSGIRQPMAPVPSERFLPVPSAYALGVELTKLCDTTAATLAVSCFLTMAALVFEVPAGLANLILAVGALAATGLLLAASAAMLARPDWRKSLMGRP